MNPDGEQAQTHEWQYLNKDELTQPEFFGEISKTLQEADVLSVGEHHDDLQDSSFAWIQQYTGEILQAYDIYGMHRAKRPEEPLPDLDQVLPRESDLLARLTQEGPTFEEAKKMHVGRLFTFAVLPLAASAGYTDVVLEGLNERNPGQSIQKSKDKSGDLLRLTMAMWLGMDIHGAYPEGSFPTPEAVGDSIFEKLKAVKEAKPAAKVIAYNGATHNMTEPFKKGTVVDLGFFGKTDASEWSYAPKAKALWGDKYKAIDLINGDRELPASHFRHMQQKSAEGVVTRFTHGVGQKSYVFK